MMFRLPVTYKDKLFNSLKSHFFKFNIFYNFIFLCLTLTLTSFIFI